jgi:hypothetical protein
MFHSKTASLIPQFSPYYQLLAEQIEDFRQRKYKIKKYKNCGTKMRKRRRGIHRICIPLQLSEAAGRHVVLDPSLTVDGKYFHMSPTSSHLVVLRVADAYAATHYFVLNEFAPSGVGNPCVGSDEERHLR